MTYGVTKTVPIKMLTEKVFCKYCRKKIENNKLEQEQGFHLGCHEDVELYKDVFAADKEVLRQIASTTYLDLDFGKGFDDSKEYGRITELNIKFVNTFQIPGIIDQLTELRKLLIKGKHNFFRLLPNEIGNLFKLETLDFTNGRLSKLPDSIGNLENLLDFSMSYNYLEKLPNSFGQLKKLTSLVVSFNHLSTLPESIKDLENLEYLDLGINQFNTLPACILHLKNLKYLDIDRNPLKTLPENISNLINLETLSFGSYDTKHIPDSIGKLKNLKRLFIKYGDHITILPDSLGNLINLEHLVLPAAMRRNLVKIKVKKLPEFITTLPKLKNVSFALGLRGLNHP